MRLEIGPGVRCDLITYAGRNLSGRRQVMQFFPTGARKGTIDGTQVRSAVIRALPGTRVVFAASDKDTWELVTWRAVRMLDGHSLKSQQRHGLPGVRLPDLELLDRHGAKKTDPDFESTYPSAETLLEGTGWTFGRPGKLANRVKMIRIHREGDTGLVETNEEVVAAAILESLRDQPAALSTALEAATRKLEAVLEGGDVADRIQNLRDRFSGT